MKHPARTAALACAVPFLGACRHAVFANPAHDFPQRVAYRREGDRLIAKAEGIDERTGERRSSRWVWRRVP